MVSSGDDSAPDGSRGPGRWFLSRRMVVVAAWGGAIALAVGIFVAVTHLMRAEREATIDVAVLRGMARLRTPSLTAVMVDITAFGSATPIIAFLLVGFAGLIVLRDR